MSCKYTNWLGTRKYTTSTSPWIQNPIPQSFNDHNWQTLLGWQKDTMKTWENYQGILYYTHTPLMHMPVEITYKTSIKYWFPKRHGSAREAKQYRCWLHHAFKRQGGLPSVIDHKMKSNTALLTIRAQWICLSQLHKASPWSQWP